MLSTEATKKGWYSQAEKIGTGAFWVGNSGRKAVVLHVVEGSYAGAISVFQGASAQKSAHFLIRKDGHVAQFVSIFDSAWANGLSWNAQRACWVDPEGNYLVNSRPSWGGLTPPINPNKTTISIEEEGIHTQPRTSEQVVTRIALLRWVAAQIPSAFSLYLPLNNLIGHCHLSPIERANCPGPHVDYAATAKAANGNPPSSPPPVRYRALGVPVYQQENCTPGTPLWGHLAVGETVAIDATYPGGRAHLADGRGFIRLDDSMEAV